MIFLRRKKKKLNKKTRENSHCKKIQRDKKWRNKN
jgi:hypothetical protein